MVPRGKSLGKKGALLTLASRARTAGENLPHPREVSVRRPSAPGARRGSRRTQGARRIKGVLRPHPKPPESRLLPASEKIGRPARQHRELPETLPAVLLRDAVLVTREPSLHGPQVVRLSQAQEKQPLDHREDALGNHRGPQAHDGAPTPAPATAKEILVRHL